FARPSGKSIYNQRKDYGQILLKPQSNFQHHVEHLLTVRLERDIRSTDDCLARLKVLEAQGRVWGQDLILQVKDQELMLRDVETPPQLSPPHPSLPRSSLDMPQSSPPLYAQGPYMAPEQGAEIPAPDFHASPQRGLPSSDYGESWVGFGACLSFPRSRGWEWGDGEQSRDPLLSPGLPDSQQMPQTNPPDQVTSNVDRDVVSPVPHPPHLRWGHPSPPCWHPPGPILLPQEVLNHVLSDLELFVVRLKTALGLVSTTNTKKKKKMNKKGGAGGFPSLAPAVEAPLLVPEAVELLEKTLHQNNYSTWKSLGMAWNKTGAGCPATCLSFPNLFSTPTPLSAPCTVTHHQPEGQSWPSVSAPAAPQMLRAGAGFGPQLDAYAPLHPISRVPLPAQGLVRALYEFQGRNPRELSVRMGDTLQVLDQQKKWWLVQDSQGQKGYIPSNILEPLEHGHGGGHSDSPPNLRPNSSPAEVTAWLKDKGFSRITVRCLGVLTGHQLLQMSPTELQAVCPEEWRRVLFKLSSVKMSLGWCPTHPTMEGAGGGQVRTPCPAPLTPR
uniref:EPS8 like 3 n=1 Tax=Buteo japonicus TaxID=224669 RepID=A0A8C0AZT9_9AVES